MVEHGIEENNRGLVQAPKEENMREEKQISRTLRHSITQKFPTIVTPSNFAKKVTTVLRKGSAGS